jgi:hypothetical protein
VATFSRRCALNSSTRTSAANGPVSASAVFHTARSSSSLSTRSRWRACDGTRFMPFTKGGT